MATKVTGRDALNKIIAGADKKYGMTVGPLAEIATPTKWISTGNMAIDYVTGGGVPLGRSIEMAGTPSSGKSTSALQAAANLQKIIKSGGDDELGIGPEDVIIYFDYEQAMDPDYARALGLDVDDPSFLFTQPSSLQDGANFALAAGETGQVRMMIFDSVATMIPDEKREKDIGAYHVGLQAKLLTDFGTNLNAVAADNNISVVYINHTKEKIGMGGRPGVTITTTPGGVGLKYLASVRLEFKQLKQHKSSVEDPITGDMVDRVTATDVKVKTAKNKLAPPFRESLVRVRFGKGFDNFFTAVVVLLGRKRVMHSTGIYYFHKLIDEGGAPSWMPRATTGTKRPYIKGLDNLIAAAEADKEWADNLIEIAQSILDNPTSIAEDEDDEELEEVVRTKPNKVSL